MFYQVQKVKGERHGYYQGLLLKHHNQQIRIFCYEYGKMFGRRQLSPKNNKNRAFIWALFSDFDIKFKKSCQL